MGLLEQELKGHLAAYSQAFADKVQPPENDEVDILMEYFHISSELKRENRQYWGRELGMCFQRLVVSIAKANRRDFAPALRIGGDEPCDLRFGGKAIDTKYRIGSGDSGTLKKFKQYGADLKNLGYEPVMLLLRSDNLPAAISALRVGGWTLYQGEETLNFIKEEINFDLEEFLFKSRP